MSFDPANRVAVVLPNWVGDVVMATPVLGAMRRQWVDTHITYVGRPAGLAVLEGVDWADATITDSSSPRFPWAGLIGLVGALRAERFDQAVLFPNSFRTALVTRAAGIESVAGYQRDGRGWMLQHKAQPPREPDGRYTVVPAVEYYIALGKQLGLQNLRRVLRLGVSKEDASAAEALLTERGYDPQLPVVMLNPGASFGSSKMWELTRWAELADALMDRRGVQIVLNVAPSEQLIARQVTLAMRNKPLLSFGRRANTIGMLKALAKRCDLVITTDTGTRHIAAAFSVPLVTLFGSTDPEWSRIDVADERIVREPVWCSPCQKKHCLRPAGPVYHECMARITVGRVLAEAEASLDKERGK